MTDEELAAKLSHYGADLVSAKYRALTCITHQDSGALMNLASERILTLSAHNDLLKASLAQAEHEADAALAALPDSYSQSKDWLATKDLVGRIEVLKALHQGAMENREIGWKAAEYAANRIKELTAELETERQRLAACGVVALGYFDGCADEYKSASIGDVLRLRAEVERLRKDVERYRHLRDSLCCEGYPSSEGSSSEDAYLVITGYDHLYPMTSDQKDAAIDAAIAGVTGKEIPNA